jgi:hypothetical protein
VAACTGGWSWQAAFGAAPARRLPSGKRRNESAQAAVARSFGCADKPAEKNGWLIYCEKNTISTEKTI